MKKLVSGLLSIFFICVAVIEENAFIGCEKLTIYAEAKKAGGLGIANATDYLRKRELVRFK